jgi:hypothetical protein
LLNNVFAVFYYPQNMLKSKRGKDTLHLKGRGHL